MERNQVWITSKVVSAEGCSHIEEKYLGLRICRNALLGALKNVKMFSGFSSKNTGRQTKKKSLP